MRFSFCNCPARNERAAGNKEQDVAQRLDAVGDMVANPGKSAGEESMDGTTYLYPLTCIVCFIDASPSCSARTATAALCGATLIRKKH